MKKLNSETQAGVELVAGGKKLEAVKLDRGVQTSLRQMEELLLGDTKRRPDVCMAAT